MIELKRYRYYLVGIALVLIIALVYYFGSRGVIAQNGDIVELDFVGYLEDGSVFDTSIESIAKDTTIPKASVFKLKILYEPMRFEVGAGKTGMPRLEAAVLGMKEGETKEVRLPPDEAAGIADPQKVISVPRISTQPLKSSIELSAFQQLVGTTPEVGKTYTLGELLVRVEGVTDKEVSFFTQVEANLTFETSYGTATVLSVTDTDFTYRIDNEVGKSISLQGHSGMVIEVSEEKITIDFNSPLAGKVLIFRITLVKIIKGMAV